MKLSEILPTNQLINRKGMMKYGEMEISVIVRDAKLDDNDRLLYLVHPVEGFGTDWVTASLVKLNHQK